MLNFPNEPATNSALVTFHFDWLRQNQSTTANTACDETQEIPNLDQIPKLVKLNVKIS